MDTVFNSVHRHGVLRAYGIAFAAASGPAHAQVRCCFQTDIHRSIPDLAGKQAIDLEHGNGSIHRALRVADRSADCRHLCRTGSNKETADFFFLHTVRTGIFPLGNHSRHFHRLAYVHNMIQQIRETDLDQSHDSRTGRRDHRSGQIRILQAFPDSPGYNVRSPRHLKRVIKTHLFQAVQHLADALQVLELSIQARCGQCNLILEAADGGQRIRHGHLGMITAHADTFAAVNAALINDVRPSASDADCLCRAPLQTVRTAPAFIAFQPHRMKPFLFHSLSPV